jgi:hypothetical protein
MSFSSNATCGFARVGVDGRDKRGHDAMVEPLFADQQPNAIRAGNFLQKIGKRVKLA